MATCPQCGADSKLDPTFAVVWVMVAQPLGTFSLAGVQPKVSVREVPELRHERCGWSVRGRIEGDYFVADLPAE